MMQLLNDWLLVRMEPLPEKSGSLFRVHGERVRLGTIIDTGPGKLSPSGKRLRLDVEKGERIAFFREHLEHKQGKQLIATLKELGDNLGILRVADVLFVVAPNETITVSA